jgi:hypothetical protein
MQGKSLDLEVKTVNASFKMLEWIENRVVSVFRILIRVIRAIRG